MPKHTSVLHHKTTAHPYIMTTHALRKPPVSQRASSGHAEFPQCGVFPPLQDMEGCAPCMLISGSNAANIALAEDYIVYLLSDGPRKVRPLETKILSLLRVNRLSLRPDSLERILIQGPFILYDDAQRHVAYDPLFDAKPGRKQNPKAYFECTHPLANVVVDRRKAAISSFHSPQCQVPPTSRPEEAAAPPAVMRHTQTLFSPEAIHPAQPGLQSSVHALSRNLLAVISKATVVKRTAALSVCVSLSVDLRASARQA